MIDLDEIIKEQTGEQVNLMNSGHVQGIRDCMKEAILQALEVASVEAELKINTGRPPRIDKDSILNVMEKVK